MDNYFEGTITYKDDNDLIHKVSIKKNSLRIDYGPSNHLINSVIYTPKVYYEIFHNEKHITYHENDPHQNKQISFDVDLNSTSSILEKKCYLGIVTERLQSNNFSKLKIYFCQKFKLHPDLSSLYLPFTFTFLPLAVYHQIKKNHTLTNLQSYKASQIKKELLPKELFEITKENYPNFEILHVHQHLKNLEEQPKKATYSKEITKEERNDKMRLTLLGILDKKEIHVPKHIRNDIMQLTEFVVKLNPRLFELFIEDYKKINGK